MKDYRLPGSDNPPTVVVVLMPILRGTFRRNGLLMIRSTKSGLPALALPEARQVIGKTWQETAADKIRDATGITVDAATLKTYDIVTTPDGVNLLFCRPDTATIRASDLSLPVTTGEDQLVVVHEPVETADPVHTRMIADHLAGVPSGTKLTTCYAAGISMVFHEEIPTRSTN